MISTTEAIILNSIHKHGDLDGMELVASHGIKKGTAYVILRRLVAKGFLKTYTAVGVTTARGRTTRIKHRITKDGLRALAQKRAYMSEVLGIKK